MKSVLNDRTLWYDGYSEISADKINHWIKYKKIVVDKLNENIIQFNKNVLKSERVLEKHELNQLDTSWNIPNQYKEIDIKQYILDKLSEIDMSYDEMKIRYRRVVDELAVYINLELIDLLRTLVYIIDTFKQNNIVWGVGRGSSVSSYILYLLEVHDIDSVMYELEFSEFLEL